MALVVGAPRGERAATGERNALERARLVREEPGPYYIAGRDCHVAGNGLYPAAPGAGRPFLWHAARHGPDAAHAASRTSGPQAVRSRSCGG